MISLCPACTCHGRGIANHLGIASVVRAWSQGRRDAKSERVGMGVDTAGCPILVLIKSHAKQEPMPFSSNVWCMLGTHMRDVEGRTRRNVLVGGGRRYCCGQTRVLRAINCGRGFRVRRGSAGRVAERMLRDGSCLVTTRWRVQRGRKEEAKLHTREERAIDCEEPWGKAGRACQPALCITTIKLPFSVRTIPHFLFATPSSCSVTPCLSPSDPDHRHFCNNPHIWTCSGRVKSAI